MAETSGNEVKLFKPSMVPKVKFRYVEEDLVQSFGPFQGCSRVLCFQQCPLVVRMKESKDLQAIRREASAVTAVVRGEFVHYDRGYHWKHANNSSVSRRA